MASDNINFDAFFIQVQHLSLKKFVKFVLIREIRFNEILAVGKILYKATNPAKLQEYTFSNLKKRVRVVSKPASEPTDTSKTQ